MNRNKTIFDLFSLKNPKGQLTQHHLDYKYFHKLLNNEVLIVIFVLVLEKLSRTETVKDW